MSLVDTTENKPDLNARVYRRKDGKMILFWDYLPIIAGKRPRINARATEGNSRVIEVSSFTIDEEKQDKKTVDTVICVIDEVRAQTDPSLEYYVTVWYSGLNISERLQVYPDGVYPDHEYERREQNVHLYAWDRKGKMWRKVNGVHGADGGFYLGTSQTPNKKENGGGYAREENL
jgi:hypothetical protein